MFFCSPRSVEGNSCQTNFPAYKIALIGAALAGLNGPYSDLRGTDDFGAQVGELFRLEPSLKAKMRECGYIN